jgi:hypothetical protein
MRYHEELYWDKLKQYPHWTKNRTIMHCECEHILYHNESCIERIFHCYDLENNEYIDIHVCNEWFKLRNKQYMIKNGINRNRRYSNYFEFNHRYAEDTINKFIYDEIISKYINIRFYHKSFFNPNSFLNCSLSIPLCVRPYMSYSISLMDGINMYLNDGIIQERNFILEKAIESTIYKFLSNNEYKKYNKITMDFKKILKTYDKKSDQFLIDFNELLINILNLK